MKREMKFILLFVVAMILFGIYFLSRQVSTKEVKVDSRATEIYQESAQAGSDIASDENPSDSNIPTQVVTAIPQPTLAQTASSQLSPNECQAQGGVCLYDLTCGDFDMVKTGECAGERPNGMPVDCCAQPQSTL